MATYTYQVEATDADGPRDSRTGAPATWMAVDGASGTEDFGGTAQEYAHAVLANWILGADSEGELRADSGLSYQVLVWDGPEPGSRSDEAASVIRWGEAILACRYKAPAGPVPPEVQAEIRTADYLRRHLATTTREHQRQLQAIARLAPVADLADLVSLLDDRDPPDADYSLMLGVAIEVLREKSPAAQAAARTWDGQVRDGHAPGTSLAAAVAAAARLEPGQGAGRAGQPRARVTQAGPPITVQVRGAAPLHVMTWARVSALPRQGDVIAVEGDGEGDGEGRAYTVTGVQFGLRPREGTGGGQERLLEEDSIVVHVAAPRAAMSESGQGEGLVVSADMPDLSKQIGPFPGDRDALAVKSMLGRISGVPVDQIASYVYVIEDPEGRILVGANGQARVRDILAEADRLVSAGTMPGHEHEGSSPG